MKAAELVMLNRELEGLQAAAAVADGDGLGLGLDLGGGGGGGGGGVGGGAGGGVGGDPGEGVVARESVTSATWLGCAAWAGDELMQRCTCTRTRACACTCTRTCTIRAPHVRGTVVCMWTVACMCAAGTRRGSISSTISASWRSASGWS